MSKTVQIISPIDNSVVAERSLANKKQINHTIETAVQAQRGWQQISIADRASLCHQAIDLMVAKTTELAEEITRQMGRPIQYAPDEINGLEERARYMIDIAEQALADKTLPAKQGFKRFIRRQALGVAFTIAPWNYPYLTAVNSIIPALMAGNSVLLKHSNQTLLCAEHFQAAFDGVGIPKGVFQHLHMDHMSTADVIQNSSVAYISFTGSVAGGASIEQAATGLFKTVALELGGKDAAYVRADTDIESAATNLVDGAFFNSGQSCCGIERIYVHEDVYNIFIERFISLVNQYQLGNPLDPQTTLGPMVNSMVADKIREQIKQACSSGAKTAVDIKQFPSDKKGTPYLAPQVLLGVDHSMAVMQEESFGPVVGIMLVKDDQQAIDLMNDSAFGLTASIWSNDEKQAIVLAEELQVGTVFMNRCDYLDPALAWVGVKQSGRGCALSELAYTQFTRPKSFNLRLE